MAACVSAPVCPEVVHFRGSDQSGGSHCERVCIQMVITQFLQKSCRVIRRRVIIAGEQSDLARQVVVDAKAGCIERGRIGVGYGEVRLAWILDVVAGRINHRGTRVRKRYGLHNRSIDWSDRLPRGSRQDFFCVRLRLPQPQPFVRQEEERSCL